MSEADYYPAGAYLDPNAPYNQPEDPVCHVCGGDTTYLYRNEHEGFMWSKQLRDEVDCIVYLCDACLKKEGYFDGWEDEDYETSGIIRKYVESL